MRPSPQQHEKPPLNEAAEAGDVDTITRLLKVGHDPDAGDPAAQGTTPLLIACRKGYVDVAEKLIREGGASVTQSGAWGFTPLMYAAIFGQPNVARLLLSAGSGEAAALRMRDAKGDTALDHAVGEQQWGVARLIVDAIESGGHGSEPGEAELIARVREKDAASGGGGGGGCGGGPRKKLTPAEAYQRNKAILDAKKEGGR